MADHGVGYRCRSELGLPIFDRLADPVVVALSGR